MAVEAVIFDVSDTLLTTDDQPVDAIPQCIQRLSDLGLILIAVGNHQKPKLTSQLKRSGLAPLFDHIVALNDVGEPKGSAAWIRYIESVTGLDAHQMFYVGDSRLDMVTALRGPVVYAHALWAARSHGYGLEAPHPGWVAAVVEHIFMKQHPWYWTLSKLDQRMSSVQAMALVDAGGYPGVQPRQAIIDLLKSDVDSQVGPITMKQFVMLHMLSSLYASNLLGKIDVWTTYPGHDGALNTIMGGFLDIAAKLFYDKYRGDLLQRHTVAKRSQVARGRYSADFTAALANQLTTMRVNSEYLKAIQGRRVLVLDNFLTWGPTTEAARNLLLAAGAASVVVATVGKYGQRMQVYGRPNAAWDAFGTTPPAAETFKQVQHHGTYQPDAQTEFVASYNAMLGERW